MKVPANDHDIPEMRPSFCIIDDPDDDHHLDDAQMALRRRFYQNACNGERPTWGFLGNDTPKPVLKQRMVYGAGDVSHCSNQQFMEGWVFTSTPTEKETETMSYHYQASKYFQAQQALDKDSNIQEILPYVKVQITIECASKKETVEGSCEEEGGEIINLVKQLTLTPQALIDLLGNMKDLDNKPIDK